LVGVEQAYLRHPGSELGSDRVPVGIDDCPVFRSVRRCHGGLLIQLGNNLSRKSRYHAFYAPLLIAIVHLIKDGKMRAARLASKMHMLIYLDCSENVE
jgi:hypothetical protein